MSNEGNQNIFNSENLISFIFSKWKPLLIVGILAAAGSTIISLNMQEKFKATVVLFPAGNNNLSRGFLSEQADDTKDYLGFGEDNNADQLLQVLKSDALMYALDKKFDLIHYYSLQDKWDKNYLLKAYYSDLFRYDVTQYESIEITVTDLYPKKAAELANGAAYLADSILSGIIKQRSIAAFKVVKHQYDSAVALTNKLEDSLTFYHKLGMLQWQYQVKELTAGYDDAIVKGNAQAVKQIGDELQIFQKYGNGFLTISNQLEASFEWFKQATASYMQAKANAEQSIPSFFVVDKAVPADRKSYPIRGLVVAMGTLIPVIFALLLLLIINRLKGKRAK